MIYIRQLKSTLYCPMYIFVSTFTISKNNMPKKLLLPLLIILFQLQLLGQTIIWTEDFDPPQNWELDEHWYFEEDFLRLEGYPELLEFDLATYSPIISIGDYNHDLIINQSLQVFDFNVTNEKSEIYILTADGEDLAWSHELAEGAWGQTTGTDINIDLSAYSNQEIQVKFRSYGANSNAFFYWDIFKLSLSAELNNDLSILNITGPASVDILDTGSWTVSIQNKATNSVDGFSVKMFSYKTGELLGIIDDNNPIESNDVRTYDFDWTPTDAHNTLLYAVIINEGDEYLQNNSSEGKFLRINPDIECDILVWDYDNNIESIIDPDKGDLIQPSDGLEIVLGFAGLEYELVNELPDYLDDYEIIISTMGCYCLS